MNADLFMGGKFNQIQQKKPPTMRGLSSLKKELKVRL